MHRRAQMPPGAPMPPPAGMPSAGAGMPPPPAGMPPLPGAPPNAAPMSNTGPRQELSGPLNSVSKILYDFDIGSVLDGDASKSPEDIALDIWEAYGGTSMGDDSENNTGNRTKDNVALAPEKQDAERKITDNRRWLRLPKGKTIEDITSLDNLSHIIEGLSYGAMKSKAAPPVPPAGALPPPMAAIVTTLTRYAHMVDIRGDYEVADELENCLLWIKQRC